MPSTRTEDGRSRERGWTMPRIDRSVLTAVGTGDPLVGVGTFCRWFRCFATAGKRE